MANQTTIVGVVVVVMRAHIGALFLVAIFIGMQNPELARGVSKEANFSLAILAILASLGPIPRRVQPALKHPM